MRRQLGWLCILPALASLTPTPADAFGASLSAAMQAASQARAVPPPLIDALASPSSALNAPAGGAAVAVGTTDYSLATWVPANLANFSYANRPHDYPVQMIIIHDTEGTYNTAIQLFQDPATQASANYVVSDAGQITQMVAEKDIAWHAGNWDYNTRAIGIEHEGYAYQTGWYTPAMYQASARLAASICSRWGVPMDRNHVIGHSEVPDPNNPGLYGGSEHHTDPGPNWDWTYYMGLAQTYANALPSPPHMMPDPVAVSGGTSATVTWLPAQTCHSPITGYTVTRQPDGVAMSLPATATSAFFTGMQAGVSYTFTATATNPYGRDTLTAEWRCNVAGMSVAPGSPRPSGTTAQVSATSGGCPHPLYQFWTLAPGSSSTWQIAQAYSSAATFNWNTAGLPAGTYTYSVWARDATSTNTDGYDAFAPGMGYTLTVAPPCTSVTAAAAPASPQPAGTAVTITGSASGCLNPRYEFWIQAPGSSAWQVAQAYSASATFSWNTTLPAGVYEYSVWARDAGSTSSYDAFATGTAYTLTVAPTCTSVAASAAPASPQAVGTAVTVTGTASGCPNPRYEFWMLAPGGSWHVVQPYSSSATFNWNTGGLPAGSYVYSVWVRDAGSTAGYDAFAPGTAYTLTATQCTTVTASAAPASPQAAGTAVTITGSASGCTNPRYEFWILAPGSTWHVAQAYSARATFSWSTAPPAGSYQYSVWVRDASSGAGYDAFAPGTAYTLTTTLCTSVTASAGPASPQVAGTAVTITGSASGCTNPRYEFWILAPGWSTWQLAQAYSGAATFSWNTTGLPAGIYQYSVWVHDASNGAAYDSYLPATAYTLT